MSQHFTVSDAMLLLCCAQHMFISSMHFPRTHCASVPKHVIAHNGKLSTVVKYCCHVVVHVIADTGKVSKGVMCPYRIYWMNPLQYAQKAILINEFSGGDCSFPQRTSTCSVCWPCLCLSVPVSCCLPLHWFYVTDPCSPVTCQFVLVCHDKHIDMAVSMVMCHECTLTMSSVLKL